MNLSRTQLKLLYWAIRPGSRRCVWGPASARRASIDVLHREGLVEEPEFGSRLTPKGVDVARRIRNYQGIYTLRGE